MPKQSIDADVERFLSKVDLSGGPDACWRWVAALDRHGYGAFRFRGKTARAHRAAYEIVEGPIPDGLELDHLCRTPACVNPAHLEPVTHAENVRRGNGGAFHRAKTECPQGHPYDDENTRWYRGQRYCRACLAESHRRDSEARRRRAALKPPRTHCVHGHELTPENTFVDKKGVRLCRICIRAKSRRYYEKKRSQSK
jgi:hypothetical protein